MTKDHPIHLEEFNHINSNKKIIKLTKLILKLNSELL
jgi:hypothetical protein